MNAVDTTRAEWLTWRRGGLGGSDIAGIMGLANLRRAASPPLWEKVIDAALDWDENPGDPDLMFELSEACLAYRKAKP